MDSEIVEWLNDYMHNEDGIIGYLDPSNGNPEPVFELLDRIQPDWREFIQTEFADVHKVERPKKPKTNV